LEYYFDISDAGKITVTNTFTVKQDVTGRFVLVNGGVIEVTGDLYCGAGSLGGTTQLKLTSAEDQYYEYSGGRFPALVIDKPGGALLPRNCDELYLDRLELLQGTFKAPSVVLDIAPWTFTVCTNLLYTGGVFLHNGATLRFSTLSDSRTRKDRQSIVTHLPLELPNLTLSGGATNTELLYYYFNNGETGGITVTDNLVIEPLTGSHKMQIDGGTARIVFDGSQQQHYTTHGGRLPHLVIENMNGVVPLNTTNMAVSVFELNGGEFVAPSGVLDVTYHDYAAANNLIIKSGNFIHNNGTVSFMVEAESNSSFAQTAIIEHPLLLNKFLVSGGNAGGSKTHPNLHYNFNINSNGLLAVARELRIESSDPERKVAVNGGEIETWGGCCLWYWC
jgi:hypothetical protein